jgi:hypothetical protein
MSSSKDLSIIQGDKLSATIQFSPAEDITGHTFSFSLRLVGEETTSYYDTTSGFTITDGPGGTVSLTIATSITQSWSAGTYAYQIRDESSGSEGVVSKGRLTVLPCFSL